MKLPVCLATLTIAVLSTPLHAEWRELASGSVGKISYDTASVKKKGVNTLLQYRIDYREPITDPATKKTTGSTVVNVSVDCAAKTVSLVSSRTYAASGGKGGVVSRNDVKTAKPEAVTDGSSNQIMWQAACNPAPAATPPAKK